MCDFGWKIQFNLANSLLHCFVLFSDCICSKIVVTNVPSICYIPQN